MVPNESFFLTRGLRGELVQSATTRQARHVTARYGRTRSMQPDQVIAVLGVLVTALGTMGSRIATSAEKVDNRYTQRAQERTPFAQQVELSREWQKWQADWGLLDFGTFGSSEPVGKYTRAIKRIVVELDASYAMPAAMKNQCADGETLRAVEVALSSPLRIAVAYNSNGGAGDVPIGAMKVETTDSRGNSGSFMIGINPSGFALGKRGTTFQNTFYSYGLAYFVDELQFAETHRHLPDALLRELSGENAIERSRIAWKRRGVKEIRPSSSGKEPGVRPKLDTGH